MADAGRVTIDPRCSWRLLRPVVAVRRWRDALQIDRTLVVSPAPARAPAVLAALSRPATAASLDAAFPELGMAWLTGFLSALLDAGLLGVARMPAPTAATVVGRDAVATALCSGLRADGLTVTQLAWPTEPDAWPLEPATGHEPGARGSPVVLVPAACEPDRPLTDALRLAGVTHLIVRREGGRGIVGPLVLPGRSPCVRCDDLHRRDRDPAWPRIVAQLAGHRGEAGRAVTDWVLATARLQVKALVAGASPDALGNVVEVDPAGVLHARAVAAHPGCGCLVDEAGVTGLGTMAA